MNATLLCVASALACAPPGSDWIPVQEASTAQVIPAESTPYFQNVSQAAIQPTAEPLLPAPDPNAELQGPLLAPGNNVEYPPIDPGGLTHDPFLPQTQATPFAAPAYAPPQIRGYSYGLGGLEPYRFGTTNRLEFGLLPDEDGERGLSDFEVFEFDFERKSTWKLPSGWIFSMADQFSLRTWDGPKNAAPRGTPAQVFANAIDLPGKVFRFGKDFELSTPTNDVFSYQLGFNPSINSDFDRSLSDDSINLDSRGAVFFRYAPDFTLVGGVMYWDRVDDRFIPYAGFIWVPDNQHEFRIMWPKARVSVFLGNAGPVAMWGYVRGEYHVEAYEIERDPQRGGPRGSFREQIELEDYRILFGLQTENPTGVASFWEAGWVFGRDAEFLNGTPGFTISSGFIARAGLRF